MSAAMTHSDLMRQMGTPPEDGFDPMPPRQHGYFLDIDESMPNRGIAWVWSKTIRPGRGKRRSPFARDERGPLTHVHAAADLGWTVSNARVLFRKLADQMRITIDDKGRIWLRGDAPEPRRIKGEEEIQPDQPEDDENEVDIKYIFTKRKQTVYFQQLPQSDLRRAVSEYSELKKFKNKILAEAMARGRALYEQVEDQWFAQFGFENKDQRGRPKVEPEEPVVNLSLRTVPHFVHISELNSVHNAPANSVQPEIPVVHNSPPYSSSENRDTEKDLRPDTGRKSELGGGWVSEEEPPTHSENALAATLEQAGFPVSPADELLAQFENLATEHAIPVRSVCRAIADKVAQKQGKGQTIFNAGALYGFVSTDMRVWIAQHGREIAEDSPPRRSEAEDPAEFARYLREMEAKIADPDIGDEEKKILTRLLNGEQ